MDKVPNMISTKDLAYISDAIEWNYSVAKKAYHYEKETVDEEISKALNKIYKMHKKISKDLLKLLGGSND